MKDNYKMACLGCGSISELEMFAHRGKDGFIRGWFFSCLVCREKLTGANVIVIPEGFNLLQGD